MSFQDSDLNVYFVYDTEIDDSSDDMKQAFTYIQDYIPLDRCKWINDLNVLSLSELTKKDVFVLDEFAGINFEGLKTTKCLIVGPRCLLVCLLECQPIPLGTSPVFVTSMRDLTICVSGFNNSEREKLRTFISYMGGYYVKDLNRNINYLVSNTIKSTKYEHAVINGILVMHVDWIKAVWDASKKETILATDSRFNKYRLPIFFDLNVTTSGLVGDIKENITKLLIENGGNFQKSFKSSETDVLITTRDGANSDKYNAAIRYKKEILLPDWIFESVAKGYALPFKSYKVKGMKASTPTKSEQSIIDFTSNCTQLSEISNIERSDSKLSNLTINESTYSTSGNRNSNPALLKQYQIVLAEMYRMDMKKAGTFLDGCSIYLSGFTVDEKEKLNKILNKGGATRYEEVNDRVTHIIVGEILSNEFKLWYNKTGAYIITVNWLLESIKIKQPANELQFNAKIPLLKEPELPSPQSQKSLKSLNYSFKKPQAPKRKLDFAENENPISLENDDAIDLIAQYSKENESIRLPQINKKIPEVERSSILEQKNLPKSDDQQLLSITVPRPQELSSLVPSYSENLNFLEGFTVYIDNNEEKDIYTQAISDCQAAGGILVNSSYRNQVDYAVVCYETACDLSTLPVQAKYIVNTLWIDDAVENNKLVHIEYYHKPVNMLAAKKPLEGLIIVISSYKDSERFFLESLIKIMGATFKDQYVRKNQPILICPSPTGLKYKAAIKWNFPVVNSDWLIQCSETGSKVDMESYLVGDSKIITSSNDLNESLVSNQHLTPQQIPKNKKNKITEEFTPLRHKRLSELLGPKKVLSTGSAGNSPQLSSVHVDCSDDMDEFLKDIHPNEVRECCKNILMALKNSDTLEIDRLRLQKTPSAKSPSTPQPIPDFCRTPEFQRRMFEFVDKRWHLSVKKRKPDTPLAKIKDRLWGETLPEEFLKNYFHDFQSSELNIQKSHNTSVLNSVENSVENPIARREYAGDDDTSSPAVKRIKDFIKNRDEEKTRSITKLQLEPFFNTENDNFSQDVLRPTDSEMLFSTERMVGWADNCDRMQFKGTPRFSFSLLTDDIRAEIYEKTLKLGGKVSEISNGFDLRCTHIICLKPNRGEKLLSGVSSGKWILSLNYINDSFEKGYFLNEELYEWGNRKALNLPQIQTNEEIIANCFHDWRKYLQHNTDNDKKGAFTGFKVILHLINQAKSSFKTVIESGNGVVLDVSLPYKFEDISNATHCFVDTKKKALTKRDHQILSKANVKILSFNYLATYLTTNRNADLASFTLNS